MLEINRNSPDLCDANESFDWCHPASSDDGTGRGLVPYLLGVSIVLGVLGWQFTVLIHQIQGTERSHLWASIVNILVCLIICAGMFLLHRVGSENRSLRRSLHLAEGLQEMQSALRKRNRELEVQSRTDFLTGVGNRLLFGETLEFETQRCDRYGDALSIALVEIGGLRRLHVSLGRHAVDEVLKRRAAVLQDNIDSSDWLFRWSDGEFVVLWLNADVQKAKANTNRLFKALCEGNLVDGMDLPVSVGSTTYCPQEGVDHLLARADLAKKDLFKGGCCYLSQAEAGSKWSEPRLA